MKTNGQKVLVTGADGFIGSHLVELLLEEGYKVRAFVFYNSFNSWGWLDVLPKEKLGQIEVVTGDIRDAQCIETAMAGCDMVFNLAALIAIPFSYQAPDAFVDTNIKGTLNLLRAARLHGTKKIIITSTSEVYGTAKYVPIDENHPFQGQSPYSATKIGADRIAESFNKSFNAPVVIARPFNTFGPRQSARAIIPTIITQLLSGAKEIKLGYLDSIRDFNYVEDVARGFLALARSDKAIGEEVNIASGVGVSMGQTFDLIKKIIGCNAVIKEDPDRIRPKNSEVERLIGSNEKIKQLTGWAPRYSLEAGLIKTIEWFKAPENLKRYKSDIYNI